MRFSDVNASQVDELLDYLTDHGAVVETAYFRPYDTFEGKGTVTVYYHDVPNNPDKLYLKRWRRWRQIR